MGSAVVARRLQSTGSVVVAHGLSCSVCGIHTGIWDLPGPGLEPVSPALAGVCLTIAPPGKSNNLKVRQFSHHFAQEEQNGAVYATD